MQLTRRGFLSGLAAGAGLLATPEPVRRYWQVPGNAPVGDGVRWSDFDGVIECEYRLDQSAIARVLEELYGPVVEEVMRPNPLYEVIVRPSRYYTGHAFLGDA